MIKLKNVSKFYYSKGMIAAGINKVNLEFNKGEFVVITGESGSGKSTLLNVISGLDSYEEGEMFIDGKETSHYLASDFEEYRKKYIGNIFQNFNLVNSYTVYQNIELILLINGYKNDEVKERVHSIIKKVGLEKWTKTKVSKLSGGQRQRVAIARALAKDTDVIVADEPTGNLDSVSAEGIVQLLSEISSDKLVIVVTHNYEQFSKYVTRTVKLHDGKVVEDEYIDSQRPETGIFEAGAPGIVVNEVMESKDEVSEDGAPEAVVSEVIAPMAHNGGNISVGSQFRLGVRNTFNIFTKFILLLIVFAFIVLAVTSQYTSYQHSKAEMKDVGTSNYFLNYSKDRIVLKKGDNSSFTEDDYKAIKSQSFVKSVSPYDILLDVPIFIEDADFSYQAYPVSIGEFDGKLIKGRMPEADNEIILSGIKDDYYFDKDMIDQIIDKTYKVTINERKIDVTVVGLAYKEIPDGVYMGEGDMYVSDAVLNNMLSETYNYNSKVTITVNGKAQEYVSGTSLYRIVPSSKVSQGTAVVGTEVNNFYEKGDGKGKYINVNVGNIFYSQSIDLKIADFYEKKTLEKKTGYSDFDTYNGGVFVSQADFDTIFKNENYQASIFVKDEDAARANAKALEKMGYVALPLQDVFTTMGAADVLSMVQVPIIVLIMLAVFFISYFVIRLILRSRAGYFSILRMLGLAKNKMRRVLDIEMLLIVNIAYAIFITLVALVNNHVIKVEYIAKLVEYMDPFDYVMLYLIVVVMAYLISGKFARKLFKKTAMGSFREEE
ncbi:MAG: ABC transporter ATP-binding protein [Clostridiales bacterium]|nr:ABC transporter ATP-binding protein [Clostridiales bacterium]